MGKDSVPTSAIYVTLSTTVAQLVGKMSAPWTAYQVLLWTQQRPGIVFPSDYAQNMSDTLVVLFTLSVGIGHILLIAAYRNYPPEGVWQRFFGRRHSVEAGEALSILRQRLPQQPHDSGGTLK